MKLMNMSDESIQALLGERLRRARLQANLTRKALAEEIGLSVDTVRNAESGRNVSLETLIRMLRGLGQLDALGSVLSYAGPSPVELAKTLGRIRQRASGSRSRADAGHWTW